MGGKCHVKHFEIMIMVMIIFHLVRLKLYEEIHADFNYSKDWFNTLVFMVFLYLLFILLVLKG